MKMASMWYAINSADIERSTKNELFVGINIFVWAAIAFILCLAGGAVCGSFDAGWYFLTFLITGYSAIIMGFFRSVFYLLRK
jgi:disulfide bond formation protein DsbB